MRLVLLFVYIAIVRSILMSLFLQLFIPTYFFRNTPRSTTLMISTLHSKTIKKAAHKNTAPPLDFTPVVGLYFILISVILERLNLLLHT